MRTHPPPTNDKLNKDDCYPHQKADGNSRVPVKAESPIIEEECTYQRL